MSRVLLPLVALIFAAWLASTLGEVASAAPRARDKPAVQPGSDEEPRVKPSTARERAAARRAARGAAARTQDAEEREKWLARLEARGVEPWPDQETDEEHADALAKSREMIEDVISLFPGTRLYETDHFLFTTNIPPQQVGPYIASLDKMYGWMCQLYGVPRGHKVWLGGKVPVFAFLEKHQFDAFEDRYFPDAREQLRTLANVYGLCHLAPTGEVVISCYRGDDPRNFAQMLVHETSHGFIFRYKTKARLPNWVDEGMADLIGAEMVPTSTIVQQRERQALARLAQERSLGGMLSAERVEAWQYGLASNLNRFLLQASREGYVRFIEALKEGMPWEEALREAYQSTPEQMLAHYGQWIGVPDLRP